MISKKKKQDKQKNPRNLLDMPLTAANAQAAVRGALKFMRHAKETGSGSKSQEIGSCGTAIAMTKR